MVTALRETDTVDFPARVAAETRKLINRGVLAPGLQLRHSVVLEGLMRVLAARGA